ncbi:uncharacterized protein LOC125901889 [Epinephelus fuscoguttatus]|uniref:uncharacterized protein LOC125901889 n=1 Tax=Epinephelus fuscoguttatus TaxID=293821 RepID=UPI0020D12F1F|nr:uncharacterized protein LOC125901889 [Epinephelus fuscoguttatus]
MDPVDTPAARQGWNTTQPSTVDITLLRAVIYLMLDRTYAYTTRCVRSTMQPKCTILAVTTWGRQQKYRIKAAKPGNAGFSAINSLQIDLSLQDQIGKDFEAKVLFNGVLKVSCVDREQYEDAKKVGKVVAKVEMINITPKDSQEIKGVVYGMFAGLSEKEILDNIRGGQVAAVRRFKSREGAKGDPPVMLTFKNTELPGRVFLGSMAYQVKEYVRPPLRCYNCQRYGHIADSCLGSLPVYKVPLKEEQISVTGCKCFSFGKEITKPNRTIMVLGATGAGKSTLINGMINYILGVQWEDSYRFKLVDEDQSTSQAHSQTSEVTVYNINHQEGFKIEHSLTIVDTPGFGDTRGIERDKQITEQLHNLFSAKLGILQKTSQAHSQTSEVTVYKLNHQEGFKIEHSLTIVDTPGFGDTRGIERDREITEQLRNLFTAELGVSHIDAVCFVAQAALARLTPTQKYVFDSVLSIFGKDIAENIRVLVTFADGQKPPVLEAIKASGVPCPQTTEGQPLHFKFNNSALFADNKSSAEGGMSEDDEDGSFDKMFWDMGTKSMKRFFAALNVMKTKSLTMTKEVLRERQQLENSVDNLQTQVRVGLAKLEELKETTDKLKEHEAEISRNENFEFEVTVMKPVQKDISGSGNYITNCQQCHFTCHYPCGIPSDADKAGCTAMGPDGKCRQCPGKCNWTVHFNQKYKWKYKKVKEKRTVTELKEKYLQANKAKAPDEVLTGNIRAAYDYVHTQVVKFMEMSAQCLNRLKEIALKPNPLSTSEYIDMLIEGEKSEAKPGWKQRVQSLMDMREKAQLMAKVERGEKLLRPSDH